jgi:metallo-beta-lactamase family protein
MSKLTFYGATQQVTGSCYLLESPASRVLLDCGLFQGPPATEKQNQRRFPFKPATIDGVILSHAHLDHSGLLPKLVREGYRGPVYVTRPTLDLMEIMLKDAAFLQAKDMEWENRHRQRAGRELIAPLYTQEDVQQALALCQSVNYGEKFSVAPGVEACLSDAGHIIGSAIVELWASGHAGRKKLVFSGDLGNRYAPLMPDPAIITDADVLLLESTYGDRNHRSLQETLDEFAAVLDAAADSGGNVLIPAFAVGRSQEILYRLGELYQAGRLKQQKVFLDSPMAIAATEVHQRHRKLFDKETLAVLGKRGGTPQAFLPPLQYTHNTDESMAINRITGGTIIIAGSGMCNGGRIRHHLKYNLWRKEAHVIIVGFQAQGTPGRALVDGAKKLSLLGEPIAVKAHIHTLGGFSAHAGQKELVEWAGRFKTPRPRLYLVHGELDAMQALRDKIRTDLGWDGIIPQPAETIDL